MPSAFAAKTSDTLYILLSAFVNFNLCFLKFKFCVQMCVYATVIWDASTPRTLNEKKAKICGYNLQIGMLPHHFRRESVNFEKNHRTFQAFENLSELEYSFQPTMRKKIHVENLYVCFSNLKHKCTFPHALLFVDNFRKQLIWWRSLK